MIRPLIIGQEEDERIAEIKRYAEKEIFEVEELKLMIRHDALPAGSDPGFRMIFPVGYGAVYTIENQPPHGLLVHMSFSVIGDNDPKALPAPEVVGAILASFGCPPLRKRVHAYFEPFADGSGRAINIIFLKKDCR